jgi:phenylacetate-coenzyme A ligase PaaK-like adenylate-forming protein
MEVVKGRTAGRKRLAGEVFSIGELDEAIFQIDGVLNYRCELSEAEGTDILTVGVVTAEESPVHRNALSQGVQRAVHQVPAVAKGLARGQVKVAVDVFDGRLPISKGTVKRTIVDRRSGVQTRHE